MKTNRFLYAELDSRDLIDLVLAKSDRCDLIDSTGDVVIVNKTGMAIKPEHEPDQAWEQASALLEKDGEHPGVLANFRIFVKMEIAEEKDDESAKGDGGGSG